MLNKLITCLAESQKQQQQLLHELWSQLHEQQRQQVQQLTILLSSTSTHATGDMVTQTTPRPRTTCNPGSHDDLLPQATPKSYGPHACLNEARSTPALVPLEPPQSTQIGPFCVGTPFGWLQGQGPILASSFCHVYMSESWAC